jgi:seryl-tRNA synthetase
MEQVTPEVQPEVVTEVKTEVTPEVTPEPEKVVSTNTDTKVEPEVKAEKEIMIPKERFDEVNEKYKGLASQMAEMQKAKEAMEAQLAEMKTASESTSTTIKETTEKLESQVKQYETVISEMYSTKLETVPEEYHDLIPEGSAEQKLAFINKLEQKGLLKKVKAVEIGTPLNHSANENQAERVKKMNPLQALASYYSQGK